MNAFTPRETTRETPAENLARTLNAAMDETVRRYRERMAVIEADPARKAAE